MDFKNWQNQVNQNLEKCLDQYLPDHDFAQVIRYSVLPAGKLFRPLLVYSLAHDLGGINSDHEQLAISLELHHTYTLIHDDLPAMDDDDVRRGRASCHIKFNEWKAILAGDALINLSYQVLAQIHSNKLPELLRQYSERLGTKGLILGQVMDLAEENKTLSNILKIHELKTARLIQLALQGSNLLSASPMAPSVCENLGYALGINFQLLDDLCELTEPLNQHESEVNPFLHFDQAELFEVISKNMGIINQACQKYQLNTLKEYLNLYFDKISLILSEGNSTLVNYIAAEKLAKINNLKL